jgi:predicted DNA-binding ribbon-helix-helix protein
MIRKRSIWLCHRKTSVSLEEPFWQALRMIARERKTTAGALVEEIDSARGERRNLSSAIRTFVLAYYVSLEEERAQPRRAGISSLEPMSG